MDTTSLRSALKVLADTLADRGVFAHIAVVGGGALLLEEGLRRPTQDVDVVAASVGGEPLRRQHVLPVELREAASDVARVLDLDPDWLNAGALGAIGHLLPEGFEDRLRSQSFGPGLLVSVLSRRDLLRLKLFAAYDEGPASVHFADAVAMHPTSAELEDAEGWVVTRFPAGPLPGLDDLMVQVRRATDA
ncbi:hypothetical protein FTX61_21245 [Nitriliruptoraceae bacterium ZYF776]|nr:hypothetical protein [Profundirhabdus halotolerans]